LINELLVDFGYIFIDRRVADYDGTTIAQELIMKKANLHQAGLRPREISFQIQGCPKDRAAEKVCLLFLSPSFAAKADGRAATLL
jgi:hypothetical protein